MVITVEMATIAANWWADQVGCPRFNGLSHAERKSGDNTAYEMAEIMAATLVKPVADDVRERFVTLLVERIVNEQPFGLYVDYGPDHILGDVGDAAGVPPHNWPWKTSCHFRDGKVWARSGYAGEEQELV